ncbi:MAG: ATPase [Opitutae bacterium]|nr:ATPase [Opitutae bacterium]
MIRLFSGELGDAEQKRLRFWLRVAAGFCAVLAAAQIVAMNGWGIDSLGSTAFHVLTFATIALFAFLEVLRFVHVVDSFFKYVRHFWFESILVVAVPITVFFHFYTGAAFHPESARHFLSVLDFLVIAVVAMRVMRVRAEFTAKKSLSPGMVFILSFAILIACGTIMLLTPRATVEGISFVDALFFATSAVCVTGLAPVASLSETLTDFGQIILLILAQLGGLGVMSITYFFAYFFAGGLSIRNRFAFQDLFRENNISQIGVALGLIIGFTAVSEVVGALWIYFAYASTAADISDPVFFSIFHSVMAFCNAGFTTSPDGLLPSAGGVVSAVLFLSLIGGIGFPVVKNFWFVALYSLRRKFVRGYDAVPMRLSVHSKLVLWTTGILIVGGFLSLYFSGLNTREGGFLRALFFAMGARTSGFDIGDTSFLPSGTRLVLTFLMFIGGAPFSTAGGIKVTTLAVAFLALRQYISGRRDLEIFGRRLNSDIANQALAIVLLGAAFFTAVAVVLCALHPELPGMPLIFESVSACGTVGLSCDVTPKLMPAAKCVLILAMFVGRIGVLSFVSSFVFRRTPTGARLPETSITLM